MSSSSTQSSSGSKSQGFNNTSEALCDPGYHSDLISTSVLLLMSNTCPRQGFSAPAVSSDLHISKTSLSLPSGFCSKITLSSGPSLTALYFLCRTWNHLTYYMLTCLIIFCFFSHENVSSMMAGGFVLSTVKTQKLEQCLACGTQSLFTKWIKGRTRGGMPLSLHYSPVLWSSCSLTRYAWDTVRLETQNCHTSEQYDYLWCKSKRTELYKVPGHKDQTSFLSTSNN